VQVMRLGVKKQKGFTLIELSIVLIIIGLLLAAVMKGRDLIRSAQQKKFYNQFINAWVLAYQQFNDRTGYVLGGPLVYKSTSASNATDPAMIGCDKFISGDLCIRDQYRWKDEKAGYLKALAQAGLTVPKPTYDVNFSKYTRSTVWILFGSDPLQANDNLTIYLTATEVNATNGAAIDSIGGATGNSYNPNNSITKTGHGQRGNFMLIVNLPYDVAAAMDKIIDGVADGRNGNFRCVGTHGKSPYTLWADSGNTTGHKITDISNRTDVCGGTFHWGNSTNVYVTALYELQP